MPKRISEKRNPQQAQSAAFIAYYRVSTDKQGNSGLGLEAQQEAARRVAKSSPILAEFTEVETAKKSTAANRPQLRAAIQEAKRIGAVLLIAKLDRLARNVFFISGLMESGVDFVAADMPQANRLTVHIMAAFAEHEARAISERTEAALAALKARGVKLGNPRWQESIGKARAARSKNRPQATPDLVETIHRLRLEAGSLRKIADRLNGLGVKTPSGGRWHAASVRAVLTPPEERLERLAAPKPTEAATSKIVEMRAAGSSLRQIAAELNELGLRTPSGAQWHASSVKTALDAQQTQRPPEDEPLAAY